MNAKEDGRLEGRRTKDPERTRADILDVATKEFASRGLSGARIDTIAALTRTSKRMIYYYFGSKEGLYLAVLETMYASVRAAEAALPLDSLNPVEALKQLVEQTFENDDGNEAFVRLVTVENIHMARHFDEANALRKINSGAIETIKKLLDRGRADGLFRADLDPIDIHMVISALCFFRVSNKHTFGKIFDIDLSERATRDRQKRIIVETVLRLVCR